MNREFVSNPTILQRSVNRVLLFTLSAIVLFVDLYYFIQPTAFLWYPEVTSFGPLSANDPKKKKHTHMSPLLVLDKLNTAINVAILSSFSVHDSLYFFSVVSGLISIAIFLNSVIQPSFCFVDIRFIF